MDFVPRPSSILWRPWHEEVIAYFNGADETEAEKQAHESADRTGEGDPSDFFARQIALDVGIADVYLDIGHVVAAVREDLRFYLFSQTEKLISRSLA